MDLSSVAAFPQKAATACPKPFLNVDDYADSRGYIDGRLCSKLGNITCCLPCPLTDWAYPDSYKTLGTAAEWVAVVGTICCVFLLASWAALPVEKTARHYLSICLTSAVLVMSLGFVVPLAGQPKMCYDDITPNGMKSSNVCGASGTFLILGGWCGIMWVFLRSLSLHLQICWQVVVGRSFMWFSHVAGWGIPIIGTIMALVFSGVSFRFGAQCHINHDHSLADLWIPLLVFSGLTIVVQLFTFAYCIKVYLASLADNAASTEGSGLPSYSNSIRTMTPRQAYRRVRRVIQLQWRGIAIVLIIVADVIFFSVIFVFQDSIVANLSKDISTAQPWLTCLVLNGGDKTKCYDLAAKFEVKEATVGAVLILLAMNGLWLVLLLGRWSMVLGWKDLMTPASRRNHKREFVSVDARLDDLKKDTRATAGVAALGSMSANGRARGESIGGSGAGRSSTPLTSMGSSVHAMHSHDMNNGPVDGYGAYGAFGQSIGSHHKSPSGTSNSPSYYNTYYNTTNTAATAPSHSDEVPSGRRTPDYFGQTARYNAPARSFSNPRPPTSTSTNTAGADGILAPYPSAARRNDSRDRGFAASPTRYHERGFAAASPSRRPGSRERTFATSPTRHANMMQSHMEIYSDDDDDVDKYSQHPLGMNRV